MSVNSRFATNCSTARISCRKRPLRAKRALIQRHLPRTTLSRNLQALMAENGLTQNQLSKKSGVSQRTISNMLDPDGPNPQLDNVDKVASAFGLDGWHLIMPNLIEDLTDGSSITSRVLHNLRHSSREGKEHILRVAEREAEYNAIPPREAS